MSNLVHKTENNGPDIIDSLHRPCKDKYKVKDIKLNKENAEASQEITEDIKETEVINENISQLSMAIEIHSELVEIKENVLNLPAIKGISLESGLITENRFEPAVVMDELVRIENNPSELMEKESALDGATIKESMPELTSTEENILQLTEVKENASKVLALMEGEVNCTLQLKIDLGSDISNMQQDSESQDTLNLHTSQSIEHQGPSELNQDMCGSHSGESNTQSDCSTLRKLLTTNDWSTLRHRYDISDFSSQYGNFLCKNFRTNNTILNEKSNTTKKSTEIKYVVKKKRNKNEKVLTAYKDKYITDAKKTQINVERKKTIAFLNHYNFHTNKQNRAERNQLDTNLSDINCNFSTYKEKSVNKNKLYTDVSDTIYNLQTIAQIVGKNDESSTYVSDISNLHINKKKSIDNKLHTSVLNPFYNLETDKKNGYETKKLDIEVSDVNYNFHTNKPNCTAKNKIHTATSTDTIYHGAVNTNVKKPSCNTASDTINKIIDIESHLPSYKIEDRNIYNCVSWDYIAKDSSLNRHVKSRTTYSDYGTNKCKHKSVKGGKLSNHTRTHSVHKYTREACDCKSERKSIHSNCKRFKCTFCVHKHKRNREFSKPSIQMHEGPYFSEFRGYQSTQLTLNDDMIHTRGKSFSCDLCEYKCGTKLHLVNYVKTLSGGKHEECANSSVKDKAF